MAGCERLARQEIVPLPQLHVYAFVAQERLATQAIDRTSGKVRGRDPALSTKNRTIFH